MLAPLSVRETALPGRGGIVLSELGPRRTLGASKQREKSKGKDSGGMENVFPYFLKIHSHKKKGKQLVKTLLSVTDEGQPP